MDVNTHPRIDPTLVGRPVELAEGRAVAELATLPSMSADDRGLVHGGFLFGLVDYAAMLAVNDPNVVLGSAEVRFVAPVKAGDRVVAEATVIASSGRKRVLDVVAKVGETAVFTGTMTAFVLDRHVLDR